MGSRPVSPAEIRLRLQRAGVETDVLHHVPRFLPPAGLGGGRGPPRGRGLAVSEGDAAYRGPGGQTDLAQNKYTKPESGARKGRAVGKGLQQAQGSSGEPRPTIHH